MPKYAWVVLGMLCSAAGGVAGVWWALRTEYRFDVQTPEANANLIGYGGVFAGLVGGLVSLRRGRSGERWGVPRALLALAIGLAVAVAVSPAGVVITLYPFSLLVLVGIWPFALIGGLGLLAAVWAVLWVVGFAWTRWNRAQRRTRPTT